MRDALVTTLLLAALSIGAGGARAEQPAGLAEMRALTHALIEQGRFDEAVEAYALVAEALPEDALAHYDLAGALGFVRRYAEAAQAIGTAISIDGSDPRFHELAAVVHQQLANFPAAFEATRRGAALGDVNAMYTLAGMYEHGRGTEISDPNARLWLERAALGGHLGAMDAMARVYEQGLYGEAPDPSLARRWRTRLDTELASE